MFKLCKDWPTFWPIYDEICWNTTKFSELWKLFKILPILSHGQAQVECGCSVNKNLLVENQHTTALTAQHIIHGHMVYHELESSNLTITANC